MSVITNTVPDTLPDILVVTYLQMTAQSQFRPAYLSDSSGVNVLRMGTPDADFYRFLYSSVGAKWRWRDRLKLSDDELQAVLAIPGTSVHVLYADGVPAGYIELAESVGSTKVVYFGLRPGYMGKGLGKHLLSCAVAQAWDRDAKRVWLHTCNLDGPHALDNYIKRGFNVYKVDEQPMPECYL